MWGVCSVFCPSYKDFMEGWWKKVRVCVVLLVVSFWASFLICSRWLNKCQVTAKLILVPLVVSRPKWRLRALSTSSTQWEMMRTRRIHKCPMHFIVRDVSILHWWCFTWYQTPTSGFSGREGRTDSIKSCVDASKGCTGEGASRMDLLAPISLVPPAHASSFLIATQKEELWDKQNHHQHQEEKSCSSKWFNATQRRGGFCMPHNGVWLPSGQRVVTKMEHLARLAFTAEKGDLQIDTFQGLGSSNRREPPRFSPFTQVRLPSLQSTSIWKGSGRDKSFSDILFGVVPYNIPSSSSSCFSSSPLILSPTHEEVVADTLHHLYRVFPSSRTCRLFHIAPHFRSELRPGPLRTREFIMLAGYSADSDFQTARQAYANGLTRILHFLDLLKVHFQVIQVDGTTMQAKREQPRSPTTFAKQQGETSTFLSHEVHLLHHRGMGRWPRPKRTSFSQRTSFSLSNNSTSSTTTTTTTTTGVPSPTVPNLWTTLQVLLTSEFTDALPDWLSRQGLQLLMFTVSDNRQIIPTRTSIHPFLTSSEVNSDCLPNQNATTLSPVVAVLLRADYQMDLSKLTYHPWAKGVADQMFCYQLTGHSSLPSGLSINHKLGSDFDAGKVKKENQDKAVKHGEQDFPEIPLLIDSSACPLLVGFHPTLFQYFHILRNTDRAVADSWPYPAPASNSSSTSTSKRLFLSSNSGVITIPSTMLTTADLHPTTQWWRRRPGELEPPPPRPPYFAHIDIWPMSVETPAISSLNHTMEPYDTQIWSAAEEHMSGTENKPHSTNSTEVAHAFELGKSYCSESDWGIYPPWLCSFGIGISRIFTALLDPSCHRFPEAIKNSSIAAPRVWPTDLIAPFTVLLCPLNIHDPTLGPLESCAVDRVGYLLRKRGIDWLADDRPIRAGQKFVQCDEMGIPHRVVFNAKKWKVNSAELSYPAESLPEYVSGLAAQNFRHTTLGDAETHLRNVGPQSLMLSVQDDDTPSWLDDVWVEYKKIREQSLKWFRLGEIVDVIIRNFDSPFYV